MLLATVPLLTACAGPWQKSSIAKRLQPPFLGEKATVEELSSIFMPMATGSPSKTRFKQTNGFRALDWDELEEVIAPLANKATALGRIALRRDSLGLPIPLEKRIFLVSVRPDILLLVPHEYPPLPPKVRTGYQYRSQEPVFVQYSGLADEYERQFRGGMGSMHRAFPVESEKRVAFFVELSNSFPDVSGIEAVSNQWEGVRTLEQLEADASLPFKTAPAEGMPGWRSLQLRKQ